MSRTIKIPEVFARWAAVVFMALALLWPSLAPAFASASLTPEQALVRDVALSLCSESSSSSGETGHDGKACDLCVLCRNLASAMPSGAGDRPSAGSIARLPMPAFSAAWRVPACHPLDDATGPPTGPPGDLAA